MSVSRGTKCVIVGVSGSGKSTLLNIIAGLDSVTGGSVCVNGKDVAKMNERSLPEFRRSVLGLIFQFHYLLKDFTALENVFLPAYMAGVPKRAAMEKAKSLLNDVGLSSRAEHLPSQLSGGERQRVAVARSLVNDPELILADEPTGNLDEEIADEIIKILMKSAHEMGKSVIVVTHSKKIADAADVVLKIHEGKLYHLV